MGRVSKWVDQKPKVVAEILREKLSGARLHQRYPWIPKTTLDSWVERAYAGLPVPKTPPPEKDTKKIIDRTTIEYFHKRMEEEGERFESVVDEVRDRIVEAKTVEIQGTTFFDLQSYENAIEAIDRCRGWMQGMLIAIIAAKKHDKTTANKITAANALARLLKDREESVRTERSLLESRSDPNSEAKQLIDYLNQRRTSNQE